MFTWWLIGGAAILSLIWSFYRGDKVIKARERFLKENIQINGINDDRVYYVAYHGGVPLIPRPQKLIIAVADEYLFLFNDKGEHEKVDYNAIKKVERITNRKEPDLKGRSVVLWGPIAPLFFKVRYRYYVNISYRDSVNKDNNILLEVRNPNEQERLYTVIN